MKPDLIYEQPKPRYIRKPKGWRAKQTAKKLRAKRRDWPAIREYVFEREEGICRCCRFRKAESMHELVFRSAGGKVSKRNSVAVCGDGVRGCHGHLQRNEIRFEAFTDGAEGLLVFQPKTSKAADWMRVLIDLTVCSMPGGRNEEMPA